MHLAGDVLAARFRIPNGIDCEQRRLGLHVVHIFGVIDTRVPHCISDGRSDLFDHRRPADIFREQLDAHGGTHDQTRLRSRAGLSIACKDRCVWGYDAVAAARPHHRNLIDCRLFALAVLEQSLAERLVGKDSREVVDPAVSLGLADDADDFVCRKPLIGDRFFKTRGVGDRTSVRP